jgi:DNA-directed RNA polymerase specialized sigma24 family protein
MDHPGTITRIIRDLEGADQARRDDAVRELWERFFADLTTYARRRLRAMNAPVGPADEEDAAARAFSKVCRGIERGQLKLANRVDLTRVLRSATTREVFTLLARAGATGSRPGHEAVLEQVPDPSLPPDLLLLAFDACQRLLGLLETDELRQVAVWKLVGHTNEAIATKLGRSSATVERTLSRIRDTWRRKWGDAVPRESAKSGPRRGTTQAADEAAPAPGSPGDMGHEDEAQLLRELAGLS